MSEKGKGKSRSCEPLGKVPTGIAGFDEMTVGGLPACRPSLVIGGPGTGKTLFAVEFVLNGARMFGEPGVIVSFEEGESELEKNFASMGWNLQELKAKRLLGIEQIRIEPREIVETGEYDLEGLFIRLNSAIDAIGAKRVAIDTIEVVFAAFKNQLILRSEIKRLFSFLKEKGVTAVVTGERGEASLSRDGLEEYVSDMVLVLDNRIVSDISTRRMRIIKYRGSTHGSNEYPFLIDSKGLTVFPITSVGLTSKAPKDRIPTGIGGLDDMLGGKGFYRGSAILVSGDSGTGKTSLGALFSESCCRRGQKVLFVSFEESPDQIVRDMASIGVDFKRFLDRGNLMFSSDRPTTFGLELHLLRFVNTIQSFKPEIVVLDNISALDHIGSESEVRNMLIKLVDLLKNSDTTVMMTDLRRLVGGAQSTISSIMDTWILLENIEMGGEKSRLLRVVKSRGMSHSNQVREFVMSDQGIRLLRPYVGPAGMFVGTARLAKEASELADEEARRYEIERLKLLMDQQRKEMEAQVASLRSDFASKEESFKKAMGEYSRQKAARKQERSEMERARLSGGDEG